MRAGVFLNRLVLTKKIGSTDCFAAISTYHVTDGKKGETFVSGAEKLEKPGKFKKGYRIEGEGEFFALPESRIRINVNKRPKENLKPWLTDRSYTPAFKWNRLKSKTGVMGFKV